MNIVELRNNYHQRICQEIIRISQSKDGSLSYPNFADVASEGSRKIAWGIVEELGCEPSVGRVPGVGTRFETITKDFLQETFSLLDHIRPGKWHYSTTATAISNFDQYAHLADLKGIVKKYQELAAVLGGDYIVVPDIIIGRRPIDDDEINGSEKLMTDAESVATLTPLRKANQAESRMILHASVSCKWTLRSDRAQNARTEALNLIRNRKGGLPHIVAVTAEPWPNRIATLALGTGDLDCVYHFALHELKRVVDDVGSEESRHMLNVMIDGRRLRDISDLPFDLAI